MAQYRVSGVADISYRDYETKTRASVTSYSYWTKHVGANLTSYIYSPRFMEFTGGADYQSITGNKYTQDSDTLTYNLNAMFFPRMKVNWNLFGMKSVNSFDPFSDPLGTRSIVAYDATTTTYGGTLNLLLGKGGNNNRNNNNSRNNNNNSTSPIILPNITLSHTHAERESLSPIVPQHETRDDTRGSMSYARNSSFTFDIDGGREEFEDILYNRTYDQTTARLSTVARVSSGADLRLNGLTSSRETKGYGANYDQTDDSRSYSATLDFRETGGLKHYYRYVFEERDTTRINYFNNRAEARVRYKLSDEWYAQGGLEYRKAGFDQKATATTASSESDLTSAGVLAGLGYVKTYTPELLGPFSIVTGYDVTGGQNDYSTTTLGALQGSGSYYKNAVELGLRSTGWVKDQANLTSRYESQRDSSPLQNDVNSTLVNLSLSTKRIPKTDVSGFFNFTSNEIRNEAGSVFVNSPTFNQMTTVTNLTGLDQQRRQTLYSIDINHYLASFLTLSAGASKSQATQNINSLSTLPVQSLTDTTNMYGQARFRYQLARNLFYRVDLRETKQSVQTTDTRIHEGIMYLDYRLRQIYVNMEYRIRQDVPEEKGLRVTQQYSFIKLSRPF
ncbi:MAG TPA: hypothetical protein VN604_07395 [Nitrospirota bacterium]|nr:hypothetical protein [Nitrospirota bacterium]